MQYGGDKDSEGISPLDHLSISLTGQYDFVVTDEVLSMMNSDRTVEVKWKFDNNNSKQGNANHRLHKDFVKMMHKLLQSSVGKTITGYTKAVISCSGVRTPFYAHPCFHGHKWYDWALAHFQEKTTKVILLKLSTHHEYCFFLPINGEQEAAIQCSLEPILLNTVETNFIVQIKLGMDFNISFVTVPVDALVHPLLCVIPDNTEDNCNTYYIVLPKRNWSRYFGKNIQTSSK